MITQRNKNWVSEYKYKCLDCKGIMQSKYEGEYSQCLCGNSAVDQTEYYTRVIGNARLLKEEGNK
jgi:hypothetical protein